MTGNKRQRELARAKYERQQVRRTAHADRRRRNQRITAAIVVIVLVLGAVAYVVVGSRSTDDLAATETAAAADSSSSTDEPIEEPSVLNCGPAAPTRPDNISFEAPGAVDPASTLTLTTTCGDIVIALDAQAPETTRSATFLAQEGFYDATACHRLTTDGIFVLQCGDPAGNGKGGPGYTLPDENLPAEGTANYPAGTVAMANAGPGTSGSQFFIVYEDTTLPSAYTVFGQVTSGLDIVQEIASVGTENGSADGRPRQPMVIEKAVAQ